MMQKKGINRNPINYYLPDVSSISIGEERFLSLEIFFNTEYMGKEYLSLSEIIMSSINKVEILLRQKLYENILLSGGNTAFKGLKDNLIDEIKNKAY